MKSKTPRNPRIPFEANISHDIVIPDIHYDGKVFNLSDGGIYFESNERIEPGDEICVTVKKMDGSEKTFDVKITRRKNIQNAEYKFGYGAKSIGPNETPAKILGKDKTPTPKTTDDFRGYCRHIYNRLVRFRHGNKFYNAWIRDISRGGAFVLSGLKFQTGKKVVLNIPGKSPNKSVRLRGWVVRIDEGGFAIKFNRRSDSAERRFEVDRRNGRDRRKK